MNMKKMKSTHDREALARFVSLVQQVQKHLTLMTRRRQPQEDLEAEGPIRRIQ